MANQRYAHWIVAAGSLGGALVGFYVEHHATEYYRAERLRKFDELLALERQVAEAREAKAAAKPPA